MLSLLTLILTVGSVMGQGAYRPYYKDLMPRQYCERRGTVRGDCCPSRLDDCSRPIMDTLCYCDEFCDRGASGDCCPDYFTFCLGEKPTPAPGPLIQPCKLRHQTILPGNTVQDNCNTCKCEKVSETEAKLMCDTQKCLVQEELIEDINYNSAYGWTASNYSQFWGKKLSTGLKYLLGTRYPNDMINQMYPITKIYDPRELPRSFDARDKREWSGLIGPVQDQGWCGASWAFSTATTAADRMAIQSPERRRLHLSEQNIIDCGYLREDGCQGGNLDRAWNYLRRYGVAQAECYPYESGSTQTKGSCKTPRRSRTPHALTCTNGTTVSLGRQDLIGMQPPYRIASKEQDIMHELYHSGPVQVALVPWPRSPHSTLTSQHTTAPSTVHRCHNCTKHRAPLSQLHQVPCTAARAMCIVQRQITRPVAVAAASRLRPIMQVHEDFFSYRSGVYRLTGLRSSTRTAYHSVRILGWGEETGDRGQQVKYWIVANSWGRQWGDDGIFRIVRGENEADIETFVVGSWSKSRRGGRRRSRGYRNYRRSRRHHLRSERARAKRHHTAKQ